MKYGFVYIWRDRIRNKFYIGSHWGHENDGYICSSDAMRETYKRRKQDFKRRILQRVNNREELFEAEQYWLQFIKDDELGNRYYNLLRTIGKNWYRNVTKSDEVKAKIAAKLKGNKNGLGTKRSNESKEKMSKAWAGTEAQRQTLAKGRAKGALNSPITKPGWIPTHRIGTKHTPETIEKMRQARIAHYQRLNNNRETQS